MIDRDFSPSLVSPSLWMQSCSVIFPASNSQRFLFFSPSILSHVLPALLLLPHGMIPSPLWTDGCKKPLLTASVNCGTAAARKCARKRHIEPNLLTIFLFLLRFLTFLSLELRLYTSYQKLKAAGISEWWNKV